MYIRLSARRTKAYYQEIMAQAITETGMRKIIIDIDVII